MKKIYKLILKSYLGPLVLTFFIVIFILMMNFVWRYIDELVGKGLDPMVILELIMYATINMIPMGLPLAILLATIMSMGNLGENYELLAMKSAGMSLFRIMKPLIWVISIIAIGSFFVINNLVPYANKKMFATLYDIKQQNEALEFQDGLFFNGIDNMSIRGNSGYTIFGSGVAVNRQVDKLWGYDLVVLEYGLNGMQPGQRDYSRYQGKLEDMIAYVKRSFPDAAILILGVSDRWIKGDGGWRSMNSVEIMTPFQRRASQNEGVAFWEMGKVILSYGGIGGFVRNGWAAGDYIHINFKGGARIAEPLSEAIRQRAYERLVEREGKIRDLVYPIELSPKEIFPLRRELEIVKTPLRVDYIE